ncbi:MAG: hypothetical protein AAF497_21825 [Planctomycetota bacterium]
MAFRHNSTRARQWAAFLAANTDSIAGLPRLSTELASADRFDDFLPTGVSGIGSSMITLSTLDGVEWAFLKSFVEQYSKEWESYFDKLTYVGYYQEVERRNWVPSTLPVRDEDMGLSHVVVHVWAPWNIYDREFDTVFGAVVRRMCRWVVFRSMNVDLPSCTVVCTKDDVLNVPSLAFYNFGHRHHRTTGWRSADDVEAEIREWYAESNG